MSEEKNYSQMRKEFQECFFKEIIPTIQQFERERIINLILSIFLTIFFFILCIAIFIYSALKINFEFLRNCIGIIGILFGILSYNTIPYTKKYFENSIKNLIMPKICSCFSNLTWSQNDYCKEDIFFDSNLIANYPNFIPKYDDMFQGSYRGVEYNILELLWEKTSSIVKITHHDGILIKLKMNKPFSGNTIVESHNKIHRGGIMGLLSYDYSNNNGQLNLTKLEDIEFNRNYDVYTDNEVEARYLLTPSFMQKLKTMKIAFKAKKIRCSFYKNHLLIGLFTKKDLFSICSLFKPVDDPKQFFTMYEEIVSIIKLIDHFKLDQKIGL